MTNFEIVKNNSSVIAKNKHSGETKVFTVKNTDCEINGQRQYLVEDNSGLRVRLFDSSIKGIEDACFRFNEGVLQNKLYKHI